MAEDIYAVRAGINLKKHTTLPLLIAVLVTSGIMRSPISSLGPVLGWVQAEYGISGTQSGLLTTVILLTFAVMAVSAPLLIGSIGVKRTQLISIGLVGCGIWIRSYMGVAGLFGGTAMLGIGLGMCNVLVPRAVKQHFPDKVAVMTAAYTAALAICSSLSAGLSVPVAEAMGWQVSLLIWVIPVALAFLAWLGVKEEKEAKETARKPKWDLRPMLRSRMIWKLALCMGLQSGVYFSVLAWMPAILQNAGLSVQQAGNMQVYIQIAGMVSTMCIPICMNYVKDQLFCIIPPCALLIIGILSLLLEAGLALRVVSSVCIGLGIGTGLAYTMTVLSLRAETAEEVVSASVVVQTGGYIVAAVVPMLIGRLFDTSGTRVLPVIAVALFAVGYLVFASLVALRPNRQKGLFGQSQQQVEAQEALA